MSRIGIAVLCACGIAGSAWAQDEAPAPDTADPAALETIEVEVDTAPAAPAPHVEENAARQLDEIVVTAQKTTQTLTQVPISVTAISRETITHTGSNDLADLSLYIPNARIDADDLGSPQIFIRGFGTNSFNPSFEGSVAFVQDELYFGRPGYFTEAMFDIDRIEVLRGPQGTLYGKNTIAGVFNLASTPVGDELEADLSYKFGSNGEQRAEVAGGGMFADWGGARVSGLWRTEDGELYNRFLNRTEDSLKQSAGRVKLKFLPALNFSAELTLVESATKIPFWPFQIAALDADTRSYLEGFDTGIEDDPYDFTTSFDTPGFLEKGSSTAGLKTDWQLPELLGLNDFHTIVVLGGSEFYIDQLNELDVSPADLARLDSHEDHKQLSAELRFNGASDDGLFGLGESLEFVTGAFWFESQYVLLARVLGGADLGSYLTTCDFLQLASGDGSVCGDGGTLPSLPGIPLLGMVTAPIVGQDYYQFDYDQEIAASAFFGQFTWYLTEHWAITPGVRFNREEKIVLASGHSQCPGRDLPLPGGQQRPCAMEQLLMANDYPAAGAVRPLVKQESDVSPKLVLQYFTSGGTNIYASHTRGYKSGGFNAISFTGDDLEYEPEKARTSELGVKGRFFDKTLRFNLTLYDTDFDDLQVLAFAGVFSFVSNAASAYSQGLEADFTWLTPLPWLSVTGAYGQTKARYKEYRGTPAPIRNAQGQLQIGALQDLSGRPIAFAPEQTGTLTPVLSFPLGSLLLRLSADAIYQGDQYIDTDLDPNAFVPGHWKYAARAVLASQDERWALVVGGQNLTDVRVLNQLTDALFFPGTYYTQQASGRSLFATLSVKF